MRAITVVTLVLLALVLALYWVPIPPVSLGGEKLVLGGYPWNAPSEARKTFIVIGAAITVLAIVLSAVLLKLDRDLAEEEEL